jgi:hypothetical protein
VVASEPLAGWAWLEASGDASPPAPELCRTAAACFRGEDGQQLLQHLRRSFLDRRLSPSASNAELRHLEGQRSVVAHLVQLVERGRGPLSAHPEIIPHPRDPR